MFDALEVGLRLLREVEAEVYGVCACIMFAASTHKAASVFVSVFPVTGFLFLLSWVPVLFVRAFTSFGGLVFRYVGDCCLLFLPLS